MENIKNIIKKRLLEKFDREYCGEVSSHYDFPTKPKLGDVVYNHEDNRYYVCNKITDNTYFWKKEI